MQRNTLGKVLRSLLTLQYPVTVDPQLGRRALVCLERMMAISQAKWMDIEPQPVRWDDPILAAANDLS